ncbi:MAG: phenylalanyl-tRNA synthetase beta chain [Luteibaculaceae bacterium]|jgi:phenylalanyl-tRNA synthetase beta chain
MKISSNWLSQYISTNKSPDAVSDILTQTGLEVEGLEKTESIPGGLEGIVIGKVLSCEKHPDADKLKITQVHIGGETPTQIVCGAPNVAAGQTVVVATVGCTLYPVEGEPFKIKKSKIRGEVSEGMICAEDEIGLGESHDGIMVLTGDFKPGTPAREAFDLKEDVCFEIGLTPNRTDAMGHYGVARDLKAAINVADNSTLQLTFPKTTSKLNTSNPYPVTILDQEGCPLYAGIKLSKLKVQPSPEWMQDQLKTIGIQPKNNVVDITNYVLHELGNPLHAFDADKIEGNKIEVKTFPTGTKFTTLDGEERSLDAADLVIADANKPMCLAGVLGGDYSGVTENTTRIFLEAAYFNPVRVRKTAKRHAINSDASFRFERGVDPTAVITALERAVYLLQKYAGADIESGMACEGTTSFPMVEIDYRWKKGNTLIGADLPKEKIIQILTELEFTVSEKDTETLHLQVPNYRVDVTREVDVAEEVLRIFGFNNIPIPEKLNASLAYSPAFNPEKAQNRIAEMLMGVGFSEAMNNSLTKSSLSSLNLKHLSADSAVELSNPLSSELDIMRQSLIPGLLDSIKRNLSFQQSRIHLFEFGSTYNRYESGMVESKKLCIIQCGTETNEGWNVANQDSSFYSLWKSVSSIFMRLGLSSQVSQKELSSDLFEEGCSLVIRKNKVGNIGLCSTQLAKSLGVKKPVFVAELDWDAILTMAKTVKTEFSPLPKFPESRRDLSLLLNVDTTFSDLQSSFAKADKKILKSISLFDVYTGKNLPDGKKSYTLSFTFRDEEKTLTDKVMDKVMGKIQHLATSEFQAELR